LLLLILSLHRFLLQTEAPYYTPETYVFVYLGMAVFTFPIFESTTWALIVVATMGCFVGRLHIYVGSFLTNCCRSEGDVPPPVSGVYMFIMWFSGLRGGVAFALASVSFADFDFPQTCGGLTDAQKVGRPECQTGMSDSLAILQTTLMIATFTIYVFGGSITWLCKTCKVLETPESAAIQAEASRKLAESDEGLAGLNKNCMTPWLTFADEAKVAEVGPRANATVQQVFTEVAVAPPVYVPAPVSEGPPTSQIKKELSKTMDGIEMMSIDDKIDEMRTALPSFSAAQLKKLLDEYNGSLTDAIKAGQSKGFQ